MSSTTLEKIKADFLQARKDRDHPKINFLSSLVGEIEGAAIMINGTKTVPEEITITVLKSFEKKANEFLAIPNLEPEYQAKTHAEKEWTLSYLPRQLSEDDLRKIFSDVDHSNMGMMMKHLKEKYAGQYDGKMASMIAKEFA